LGQWVASIRCSFSRAVLSKSVAWQIPAVLAASLEPSVALFAAAAAFTCAEFLWTVLVFPIRPGCFDFQGKFFKEMPYGLNWECVSVSFGMYVGKDMMESAAEREAYRRALHTLKHE